MKHWRNLCQIAISVLNMETSLAFYTDILGYTVNGKKQALRGFIPEKLQGYKGLAGTVLWLNDRSPDFQLELFHYTHPPARPMPDDRRPCDIGFCRMGIWVADFDDMLSRLNSRKVPLLTEPTEYGNLGRRVCIRDPNGVLLEIMEKDIKNPLASHNQPKAHLSVRTRSLTLSVPHLEQAEKYFLDLLKMKKAAIPLHTPEMESLWGLAGAEARSTQLWCDDVLIELVEYTSPRGRSRPPDHHMGDAGIWHMALSFERRKNLMKCYRETLRAGHTRRGSLITGGLVNVVYMETDQHFVVEYLHYHRWTSHWLGY